MSTRGFTIIETLVAITVLTISIVGPFYAVQTALTSSYVARDQLIAASLAQEAVEFMHARRDNTFLAGGLWSSFLSGISACRPGPCVIDITQNTVSSTIAPLNLSSTNLYNQAAVTGTNVPTRFTRSVVVTDVGATGTEVKIVVTVSWTTSKIPYTLVLTGYLQDWL